MKLGISWVTKHSEVCYAMLEIKATYEIKATWLQCCLRYAESDMLWRVDLSVFVSPWGCLTSIFASSKEEQALKQRNSLINQYCSQSGVSHSTSWDLSQLQRKRWQKLSLENRERGKLYKRHSFFLNKRHSMNHYSPGRTKAERELLRKSRVSSWEMLARVFGSTPKILLKLRSSLVQWDLWSL